MTRDNKGLTLEEGVRGGQCGPFSIILKDGSTVKLLSNYGATKSDTSVGEVETQLA